MISTLQSIFKIGATQSANRFIYYLKRIPLVGKLFSDGIYIDTSLKLAISGLIAAIMYLMRFVYKAFYVGAFIIFPLIMLQKDAPKQDLLNMGIHIFVWMSFVLGALQETATFKIDPNRYACIKLLHMPAKNYVCAHILLDSITYFITFLPSILIPSMWFGLPFYKGLLLTFMLIVARLLGVCIQQFIFAKVNKIVFTKWWWYLIGCGVPIAIAYLPILKGISFNYQNYMLNFISFAISVVIGLLCLRYIKNYSYYMEAVNASLRDNTLTVKKKETTSQMQFASVKLKDQDLDDKNVRSAKLSRLHGYDLLNAIFFERHRRLLIKPIFIRIGIIAALFLVGVIATFFVPDETISNMGTQLLSSLNVFIFIMYVISTGDKMGKAMFFNCDISLLRYGFYREKSVILKNFWIRMKKAIIFNLIPAIALCVAILGLLLIANVPINYLALLPFMASILILAVFFAVHHIFLYYVFQPYTTELDVKNPFFKLINSAMYLICFACLQIESFPANFVWGVLIATIVYIVVALILVLKFAPKMFKVK